MRQIIYKFSINGRDVNPQYKEDTSVDYELEDSEQFFRAKLSGKITFLRDDYKWLSEQPFETIFILSVNESKDGGKTWDLLFQGKFTKTSCEWDDDNMKCDVTIETYDQYNKVIAGLDKEYNLIELAPEIQRVKLKKRPMVQVYIEGDTVLSNIIGGMYWEQDVTEAVVDENKLINDFYFAKVSLRYRIILSGGVENSYLNGDYVGDPKGEMRQAGGSGVLTYFEEREEHSSSSGGYVTMRNGYRLKGGLFEWEFSQEKNFTTSGEYFLEIPDQFELKSLSLKETINATRADVGIYMRYLTNSKSISGLNTYELKEDDISTYNRNYRRAIGLNINLFYENKVTQAEPTKWGKAANGQYFVSPGSNYFPVARNTWSVVSYWFYNNSIYTDIFEEEGTEEIILKDAYPLSSCISVLLKAIGSDITHEDNIEYSEFLYGTRNPISYQNFRVLITPKSNVTSGEYTTPALMAKVTLRTIFDMLRDCYKCYWFIQDGKLKIEHITWFRNGGSYGIPQVGVDLTKLIQVTNGKSWGYLTSNYSYEKAEMTERYQFSWMDETTEAFESEIQVNSNYVTEGNVEEITASQFTTNIDFMLLDPSDVSQDGFALMSGYKDSEGYYTLPIIERQTSEGSTVKIQNGYLTWQTLLTNYYMYDLPAKDVTIGGFDMQAISTSRKKKQTVKYPYIGNVDTTKLVKTFIGNGQISKLSVNLTTRINEAELVYDTE